MVVVYRSALALPTDPAHAAVSLCKGLVLLWGKIVLLTYVRQSPSIRGPSTGLPVTRCAPWARVGELS
jgi:hypothetical protein